MHQNACKGFSSQLSVRVHNYYFSNDIFLFLCKPPSSALNFLGSTRQRVQPLTLLLTAFDFLIIKYSFSHSTSYFPFG